MYPHLNKNSREDILVTDTGTEPELAGTKDQKVLIAYHAHCIDGFTSAWACWKGLLETTDTLDENITLSSAEYNKIDWLMETARHYDKVYLVDFSVPSEVLTLMALSTTVIILDHHKTAIEMYEGEALAHNAFTFFDLSECGATLVWKHFFGARKLPRLLKYVRDYDLWQFKYPETRAMNMVLRLQPQTLHHWDGMVEELEDDSKLLASIAIGKAILKYHGTIVDDLVEQAEPCEIDGVIGLVVNCSPQFANDVGERLAQKSGTYGAIWQQRPDGVVNWSLRSIAPFSIIPLVKAFGGGGHPQAGGFVLSTPKEDATQLGITLWSTP